MVEIVLAGGARTPFGDFGKSLRNVPLQKLGIHAVQASLGKAGINVIDFTQPAAPQVIAYADPKPLPFASTYGGDGYPDGGDWSTYWYNGKIYEADIYRGLIVWDLDNPFTDRANTVS